VARGEAIFEIGILFYKQEHYDVALSSFLLAENIFIELQNPRHDEAQIWREKTRKELGDEKYSALLASVVSQAQQIVDQALNAGLDDASETRGLKDESL
jgi:hypothetical protein